MRTGFEDDRRRALAPGDRFHGDALRAWCEQDHWSGEEHARFWSAGLVAWPRPRGQRPVVDALSAAAAQLAGCEVPLPVIADVLGVAPDTIRPRQAPQNRERPSIERGEELLRGEPLGERLLREVGKMPDDPEHPPLPRVFADHERPPDFTYINPLIVLVEGSWVRRPDADGYAERAERFLRELWDSGRLVPRDGRLVYAQEGEPELVALRRGVAMQLGD